MTVVLPGPVPLDMPPGDPGAVDDLVRDLAGAAFHLAGVDDRLHGPGASVSGWVGDDAVAATGQIARVAGLAGTSTAAVLTAAGRLSSHAEALRDARRRVELLRDEQDEDFRSAQLRLGDLADPQVAVMTGGGGWAGIVAEVEAADAARRRRHEAVLEALAEDAAATARVLADASRPLGGTGRAGDGDRVAVHLAAELPGWGDPHLSRRGVVVARALLADDSSCNDVAQDHLLLAGSAPFAQALLLGLGADGLRAALRLLGDGAFGDDVHGPSSAVARLLSSSLGAVGEGTDPRVGALLAAPLVRARDETIEADLVAVGMGAVLAARAGSNGPGASTVAAWGRQIVAREHVMTRDWAGAAAADRVSVHLGARGTRRDDPLPLVVGSLARSGDAGAAAALLGSPDAWVVLLGRSWADDAAALGRVIENAAVAPGVAGEQAVRYALEAVGGGLPEASPRDWAADRGTVESLAPALGRAVAARVEVAAAALASAAGEGGGDGPRHLIQGLGYLTVDRQAAATVEGALTSWVAGQSHDLAGSSRAEPLPLFAVPGAYVAVQEYGQRLSHALDGYELEHAAQQRALVWNFSAGLVLEVASFSRVPLVSVIADGLKVVGPPLLNADGTFTQGPDRGLRYGEDVAGADVVATLPPDLSARVDAARAQAEAAYRRTSGVLGDPDPPISPERWRVVLEGLGGPKSTGRQFD
ncbi:hypothetical protein [Blastococcus haudaquaticus]|uniref:Uncharacterized protein n=1 Tax=Blastococcus haudaquaticus TaxID=1938745 RepID=A0A286GF91_9ACTN|nr:hypothetical protein [Blastococcus haudaquaticus]SOD94191.1 hypothetical protein SAMN06272739_0632 [Blastococcus haudaquaticus]